VTPEVTPTSITSARRYIPSEGFVTRCLLSDPEVTSHLAASHFVRLMGRIQCYSGSDDVRELRPSSTHWFARKSKAEDVLDELIAHLASFAASRVVFAARFIAREVKSPLLETRADRSLSPLEASIHDGTSANHARYTLALSSDHGPLMPRYDRSVRKIRDVTQASETRPCPEREYLET